MPACVPNIYNFDFCDFLALQKVLLFLIYTSGLHGKIKSIFKSKKFGSLNSKRLLKIWKISPNFQNH
jgi:hypothetical protein